MEFFVAQIFFQLMVQNITIGMDAGYHPYVHTLRPWVFAADVTRGVYAHMGDNPRPGQ